MAVLKYCGVVDARNCHLSPHQIHSKLNQWSLWAIIFENRMGNRYSLGGPAEKMSRQWWMDVWIVVITRKAVTRGRIDDYGGCSYLFTVSIQVCFSFSMLESVFPVSFFTFIQKRDNFQAWRFFFMTLTYAVDLDGVKMNHRVKYMYLDQRSWCVKVITDADAQSRPTTPPGQRRSVKPSWHYMWRCQVVQNGLFCAQNYYSFFSAINLYSS